MAEFTLSAEKRTVIGKKVRGLRREGLVPATVYGPQNDPISLQFPYREIERTLMNAGGTNIIDIQVDGENYPVLARDVQRDVLKGSILHVDFFAPDMNKVIRAEVPVSIEGVNPLVASRQGILITGPNTLTVEMLPSKMINEIAVNIEALEDIGATVSVKDLELADGVKIINDPEEMIAKIVQPSAARAAEMEAMLTEGEDGELVEGEEGEVAEGEDDDE